MSKPFLRFYAAVALLSFGLAAFAQSPPPALAEAEQAIDAARRESAETLSSEAFGKARSALDAARTAAAKRRNKDVARHALRALRYAELALSEARYLTLRDQVESRVSENAALRRELLLGVGGDRR